MAAEIKPVERQPSGVVQKPELISKIEGFTADVNFAAFIPREDGVITVSDDRTVRVWIKRNTGQYWPSICHTMPAVASCLEFFADAQRLFVGLGNGTIKEFHISEDFNKLSLIRDYLAHQDRVTCVQFSPVHEFVLSCSRDKYFEWHCSQTGRRLGGYLASAWTTCLQFDTQSLCVFVGDYSGQIAVLKISRTSFELLTVLKGHTGSIRSLSWDSERSLLFSASFDQVVVVWDIGGQRGTAFELQGHRDRVQSVVYAAESKQLLSGGDDSVVVFWNVDVKRQETPEWAESDKCQKCGTPFFWNVRSMWTLKTVGVRQHHCRRCGRAFCAHCSQRSRPLPRLGYEFEVRVCDACDADIAVADDEQEPLASIHDVRHKVTAMDLDERRKLLITVGRDRVVKIWDVSSLLC